MGFTLYSHLSAGVVWDNSRANAGYARLESGCLGFERLNVRGRRAPDGQYTPNATLGRVTPSNIKGFEASASSGNLQQGCCISWGYARSEKLKSDIDSILGSHLTRR